MRTPNALLALLVVLALFGAACGGGADSLVSQGAGDEATDDADGGEDGADEAEPADDGDNDEADPEPTAEPTDAPEPTPEPTEAPEPTAAPTSPPAADGIVAVFADGTIDFDASEDNLRGDYGGSTPEAVVGWFETRGIDPADVAEIHRETLSTLDPDAIEIFIPFMQVVTVIACEAGALGWNADQFLTQYVNWNVATEEGDPENLEIVAQAVGFGAITAADQVCAADSPTYASGEPELPVVDGEEYPSAPEGDDFLAQAAALAGCTPDAPQGATGAEIDYQATLVALGFIESFDEADVYLPVDAVNCFVTEGRDSGLKFWQFAETNEALLASEPVLLAPGPVTEGSCWAITGYFETLVLGVSAPGVSPSAVDHINAIASLDAPLIVSGGECG